MLPLNHRQKINHGGSLTIQTVERLADQGEYSCVVRDPEGLTATSATYVSVVGKYIQIYERSLKDCSYFIIKHGQVESRPNI